MNEGLSFEKLAIGPFYSYDLAERAKYVFRKNDGSGSLDKIDTLKIKSLKMMAKKWKSLKLDITKKSDDKTINKTMYRFSTNFPKSYFSGDATQIITVTANYTDSYHSSRSSFTLQGDEVTDNNHVIVSNTSTVYINILPFDIFSPSKIKGFLFESFIYNDCELIELEPVYITLIK